MADATPSLSLVHVVRPAAEPPAPGERTPLLVLLHGVGGNEEAMLSLAAAVGPRFLVVSTIGDPATPYESGVAVADHLATGVLLTYEGDGHTIAFSGSDCVDDAVVRYLVELTPPDDGTRCPA